MYYKNKKIRVLEMSKTTFETFATTTLENDGNILYSFINQLKRSKL
jgi:hypothetical protein